MRVCLYACQAHEAAHGLTFDWVTRARPDLAFIAPLPPLAAFAARGVGTGALAFFSQKVHSRSLAAQPVSLTHQLQDHVRSHESLCWPAVDAETARPVVCR